MQNLDKIKDNLKNYTTLRLCEIVVSCRYLGMDEDLVVMSMTELGRRRSEQSEDFEFESFIEEKIAALPEINVRIPDVREMMATLTNLSKKNL